MESQKCLNQTALSRQQKLFYYHLRGFVVGRDAIVGRDVVVRRHVVVRRVDFSGCAFDEWIFQGFLQLRQID
jgi:hypothetical protein